MKEQKRFPDLETERLTLRNVSNKDIDFIFQLFSNQKVCEYLYDEELYTERKEAIEFVEWNSNPEEKGYNRWVLTAKNDHYRQIGTCGYDYWDRTNNIAEIGYDLWHEYWGQGYMREALIVAIESGFNNMGLNRINAYVALENTKSIKLLERIGFTNEGIYRDKHLFRGKYYDHYSFSLLKREWNQL
ncbi:GNAT family N-acetyltransferase [Gracilibacillus oryzae]|uniref:GNAT family N-acetyltransferase n=1 Tax=Gracilibacillus oryzae TaxID=1672701 RepID=A0A7C8KQ69_9BACI|nr:GNAT family protein [Gracilibacillus oryzae]KAB8135732.1 GNAT family N-acetyltransferase [Gracilibacillus oryzae]